MAERPRKPGETYESFAERLIREAQAEGVFDRLAGAGKPLPLYGGPLPEAWWIKEKLRSEQLSTVPDSIAIRHEAEVVLAAVARDRDQRVARERLEALNAKIRHLNRTFTGWPPTTLAPLDVEEILRRWRDARLDPSGAAAR
jgi:DnaJ homologue, subfamily C, member 28, conserved domain